MNTKEFLAVSELVKACGAFNGFVVDAVTAARNGVPLSIPDKVEDELHDATVQLRTAVKSLEPRVVAAINRIEQATKNDTVM